MIRKYKASDFSEVAAIFDDSKDDEFAGESFSVEAKPLAHDKKMQKLLGESDLYVYQRQTVIGFVGHKGNHISWVFVDPNYRHEKIATELVSFVLSKLEGEVTLNVTRSNQAAYHLYKGLGFTVIKEFSGMYQKNPMIIWKMRVVL